MNATDLIKQQSDLLELAYQIKTAETIKISLSETIRQAPYVIPELDTELEKAECNLRQKVDTFNEIYGSLKKYTA